MLHPFWVNEVRNGAISITQWNIINDCCKVNLVGQAMGKNLVMAMGLVDLLGQYSIYHDKVFLIWMKQ